MISYLFRILLLFVSTLCCRASYLITIKPKEEECFYVTPIVDSTIFGNFEVLDDKLSAQPLSLIVTDVALSKMKHRSRRGARDGTFKVSVDAKEKTYICIQNGLVTGDGGMTRESVGRSKSDNLPRTVGIDITVEAQNVHNELHENNANLLARSLDLTRELGRLRNHHEYSQAREAIHREVVETTFSKLMAWAIAQSAGVVVIAVGQIMFLRRFLERRRYM
jgi:hypothetical protein